jgi:hypothetical protein
MRLDDINAELLDLVYKSVEMGLASIKGDEDLIPVLNIKLNLIVLQTETLEEARDLVPHMLRSSSVEHGVLMYNSYTMLQEGMRVRTLHVEVYESSRATCARFMQNYRPSRKGTFLSPAHPFELIGELTLIDDCDCDGIVIDPLS